jgi:SnoaL-like domain
MTDPTYKELEARLRELEDVHAINEVFYTWHYACTGGFNGIQAGRMEALECLTEDASIEIAGLHKPGQGPTGREAYTKFWDFYYGDDGPLPYVFQTSVADKVEVNGDTAVQRSNMLGLFQARGHQPTIGLSRRTNDYVRTPDGWKIKKTTVDGGFSAPLPPLQGNLNPLPEKMDERTPWTYEG